MKNKLFIIATALLSTLNITAGLNPGGEQPATTGTLNPVTKPTQKDDEKSSYRSRNVIKVNLTQLAAELSPVKARDLSVQYEFAVHKNISIAIGGAYIFPTTLTGLFKKDDPSSGGLRNTSCKGFNITPEVRFYPGKKVKHRAPHGFYLAGYARYAKYDLTSSYYETTNGTTYGYNLTASYAGYTGGLMIGYQWIIAKHLSIDFWIVGGGVGQAKLTINGSLQGFAPIPQDEQDQIKKSVKDILSDAEYLKTSGAVVETTSNSIKVTDKLPMASVRGLGFCIGFAF